MKENNTPVKIIFGIDTINRLGREISSQTAKDSLRVLILTGITSLKQSGYKDIILNQIEAKSIYLFDRIKPNPDIVDLFEYKKTIDRQNFNLVIAIGGGSVIDVAKSIVAFQNIKFSSVEELRKTIFGFDTTGLKITSRIIAIPTVSGSGSEYTCWATLWDKELKKKWSIEHPNLYPEITISDPELTINLPLRQTAISALDALCHATEAYWSKKTTEEVRENSLKAIKIISSGIMRLFNNLSDTNLRKDFAKATLYAGLAFNKTKTTACHSISYPLTLHYNIEHGIAVSITLSKLLEINSAKIIEKDSLFNAFGIETTNQLEDFIHGVYTKIKVSRRLNEFGIPYHALEKLASESFTSGRIDNNPVQLSEAHVLNILQSVY